MEDTEKETKVRREMASAVLYQVRAVPRGNFSSDTNQHCMGTFSRCEELALNALPTGVWWCDYYGDALGHGIPRRCQECVTEKGE